ncbi:hypothetical protein DMC61_11305 [Amycolatopsis sp. WAC 04169]|uniref:hypothetical protein n=1 Tax=Amycolatopsis sp. WAC 04169 TaxID=2203197 RepID=UPI000F78CDEB|nr:hypothetical protein [Amycolatopsis sp. WAC 04169]RSN32770.1 hypothetical protein DMC61_11305 [Amycolatopsis sp. WAC 04169]
MFQPGNDPDCKQVPTDFTMKTAAPIGKRPVLVNAGDTWGLTSTGWRKCDQILGCEPPTDHCAEAWVAQVEFSAEAEHPYRWAGNGWMSFASAKGGGCGEILAAEPAFPTHLCQNLTPPS